MFQHCAHGISKIINYSVKVCLIGCQLGGWLVGWLTLDYRTQQVEFTLPGHLSSLCFIYTAYICSKQVSKVKRNERLFYIKGNCKTTSTRSHNSIQSNITWLFYEHKFIWLADQYLLVMNIHTRSRNVHMYINSNTIALQPYNILRYRYTKMLR